METIKDLIHLEESVMGFKLPDGNVFLLHKKDVEKIKNDICVNTVLKEPQQVMMLRDTGLERAIELYKIYEAEKDVMTKSLKDKTLKTIIKFLTENNYELETLKDRIDKAKK